MTINRRLIALGLLATLIGCGHHRGSGGNRASFRAGSAKVKITPPTPGWMTGYGTRKTPAEGVHTDLFVRALAIEDGTGKRVVLVSADILGFPSVLSRAIRDQVKTQFGLAEGDILLSGSHTHGGPALPQYPSLEILLGLDDAGIKGVHEYAAWFQARVIDAVAQAMGTLQPARLSFGRTEAHFAMNRRTLNDAGERRMGPNLGGVIDPDLPVLKVDSDDGRLRAVVFTYACHGTTLGDFMRYHADWIGVATERIEAGAPGTIALYVTGCGGDNNPHPRGKPENVNAHGHAAAAAVLALLRAPERFRPLTGALVTAYARVDLPLGAPPPRDLLEARVDDEDAYRRRHARVMLRLMDAGTLPTVVSLPIAAWSFGPDLTLIALGGEVTVEYALRLKRELGAERTWVAGYANEVPCYIPSETVLREGGYEAGWENPAGRVIAAGSMALYGWPAPFADGIEERLVGAVHGLLGR